MNTFIVTNANNCPNLLSHVATFRMGVLLPNYPEENVVKSACGENVPNFKYSTSTGTSTGTSSNVFQILQDLWLKQYQENHPDSLQNESRTSCTSTTNTTSTTGQLTPFRTYRSTTANEMTGTLIHNANVSQSTTSFRTTTPPKLRLEEPILSGPHPILDIKDLKIHHITDTQSAVCMYTNPQVRFVIQENH